VKGVALVTVAVLVVIGVGVGVEAGVGVGTPPYGVVCGATWRVGGPYQAKPSPALLRSCPSGPRETSQLVKLLASDGTVYSAYSYSDGRWSAELPAGTYRAVDAPGCPFSQTSFTVVAGRVTLGVIVRWGCMYS